MPPKQKTPTHTKSLLSQQHSRADTEDRILGQPSPLSENVLPTYLEVGRAVRHKQKELQIESGSTANPPFKDVRLAVATKIYAIWDKATVPCAKIKTIEGRIDEFWSKKNKVKNKKNVDGEMAQWSKIFDVSLCKCPYVKCDEVGCMAENCSLFHGVTCTCTKESKVPPQELSFLHDQRHGRKCTISEKIDKAATKKMAAISLREEAMEKQRKKEEQRVQEEAMAQLAANEDNMIYENIEEEQEDSPPATKRRKRTSDGDFVGSRERCSDRNMQDLENLAEACDRFDLDSNAIAYACNAYQKDIGMLTRESTLDRKKVDRSRIKYRKKQRNLELEQQKKDKITAVYHDGRRDKTLVTKTVNGISRNVVEVEEHISIIEEPGSRYLSHVTPKDGTGKEIAKSLFKTVVNAEATDTVAVVGNDGCSGNNGADNGACAYFERYMGKPLQRVNCLLHCNELPFKASMVRYMGPTKGPSSHQGPINKAIHDPHLNERPIAKFKKIDCPDFPILPEEVQKEQSTDQLYLYDICHGLISGEIDESLAARSIGKQIQSRWNNSGSAIGRHYASEEEPSQRLIALTNIMVKLYAKMFFRIKCNPKAIDGARHIFEMISIARTFPKEDKEVLFKRIQWNAYFAHSEWILLTMASDPDPNLRKRAAELILKARKVRNLQKPDCPQDLLQDYETMEENIRKDEELSSEILLDGLVENDSQQLPNSEMANMPAPLIENDNFSEYEVRKFRVPKLNFEATAYWDMIDIESELYEPPLTMHLSDEQIKAFEKTPLCIPDYPNHTQAVERAVKLTTEAAGKVVGFEQRHGMICQRIKARKQIPRFLSKKDALPMLEKP